MYIRKVLNLLALEKFLMRCPMKLKILLKCSHWTQFLKVSWENADSEVDIWKPIISTNSHLNNFTNLSRLNFVRTLLVKFQHCSLLTLLKEEWSQMPQWTYMKRKKMIFSMGLEQEQNFYLKLSMKWEMFLVQKSKERCTLSLEFTYLKALSK
jgi:hypothetical protein